MPDDEDSDSEVPSPHSLLDDVALQEALASSFGDAIAANEEQGKRDDREEVDGIAEQVKIEEDTRPPSDSSVSSSSSANDSMLVQMGRRLIRVLLCRHPPFGEIIDRVGELSSYLEDDIGAKEIDTVWCQRCMACREGHEQDPEALLPLEEENKAMEEEDSGTIVLTLERDRDAVQWRIRKGATAQDVLHYAAVKRVRESSLRLFQGLPQDRAFLQDEHMILKTRPEKKLRGGNNKTWLFDDILFVVKDHSQGQCYLAEAQQARDSVDLSPPQSLWYRGAQLQPDVDLCELQGRELAIAAATPCGWPRIRSTLEIMDGSIIHLGEISEWLHPCRFDPKLATGTVMPWQNDIIHRWNSLSTKDQHALLRGGAGNKGQPRWESTHLIQGITLLAEFKVGMEKLPVLKIDEVCNDIKGVVCCLMSSWTAIATVTTSHPRIRCFPGKCGPALVELGGETKTYRKSTCSFERQRVARLCGDVLHCCLGAHMNIPLATTSRR